MSALKVKVNKSSKTNPDFVCRYALFLQTQSHILKCVNKIIACMVNTLIDFIALLVILEGNTSIMGNMKSITHR